MHDGNNNLDSDSQERYLRWSKSVNINLLVSCPFDSIIIANTPENECIEVSSVDFFSEDDTTTIAGQEASKKQMKAFEDHLKRSVEEKIWKAQCEEGKPCITLIKSRRDIDWHYEYESDINDFLQLQKMIKEELKKTNKISGVIIYYSEVREGKYIENKNADPKIKIELAELQDMNILRPYNPILIDEENKIEPQDAFNKQREKIIRCIDIEQDIIEWRDKRQLLENIRIFLDNSGLDENILGNLERIILKYCQDNSQDSDYRRILEKEPNDLIIFEGVDIKADAVTCLLVLLNHKYSKKNIDILAKLCEEDNLSVRLIISNKLSIIYETDRDLAIKIITKFLRDTWFSRYSLMPIMNYFYHKNIELPLQLEFVNTTIKYYEGDKKHCTETMSFAADILLYNALRYDEFKELVFSLLKNTPEGDILRHIANSCGFGNKVKTERFQKLIININTDILDYSSSLEVKQIASYRFLTNLIKQNVSLYPAITDYLDKVSRISGTLVDKQYLSFSIFEYLSHFCENFAVDSCLYLRNVISSNKIEDLAHSSHDMFNRIERLLSFGLPLTLRDSLFKIIKMCSINGEHYCKYQADLLKEKYNIR